MAVPEVLLSGHHGEIAAWRRRESIARTARRRPDLLARAELTPGERRFLDETLRPGGDPVVAQLFRVVMPVPDFERGVAFYAAALSQPGELVAPNRHYFRCGGTVLAVVDPSGHDVEFRPNVEHVYFAVPDLKQRYAIVRDAAPSWIEGKIARRPWGEKSFYARDPFGNPVCFVDDKTVFLGGSR
jgi:catechol 2,3-dioxygenase-like lactoylglutathione lyase family enzyme